MVQSVLGPVDARDLGRTLIHEHLVAGLSGASLDPRWTLDRRTVVERACAVLASAQEFGLTTLVDATTIEMGRDPELIAEVAQRSGVTIVCSSGLYASDYGLPTHFREMPVEDLAALYVGELTEGIGRTGVRSGMIKVATSGPEPSPSELRVLEAAAIAQQHAGVPIITHTTGGGGDRQAAILIEHGVPPAALVIGHVDHKNSSYRYLARILRTGAGLAFDRVGSTVFLPDSVRAGLFAALVQEGHAQRMFLSMDAAASWVGPVYLKDQVPPPPYRYLLESFLPILRSMNVAEEVIDGVLVENPRRLFEAAESGVRVADGGSERG